MVKRKTQLPDKGQGEMEDQAESETYETGADTEVDEIQPGTSQISDVDDEQQDETMVLRPRQKLVQPKRTPCSPRRPRTSRYKRPEAEVVQDLPDNPAAREGLYNIITTAFQEMTRQLVGTIQKAFKGRNSGTQETDTTDSPDSRNSKKIDQNRGDNPIRRRPKSSKKTQRFRELSSSSESSSDENLDLDSDSESIKTDQIFQKKSKKNGSVAAKLPAFTGKEKWEVWFNRFEAVAELQNWDNDDKLQELLPRLQGAAGDFTFDQLSRKTLRSYQTVIKELENRFGVYENKKNYKVQFNRRNQKNGETAEAYAAELKRIYDKAYANRDAGIRQEDLLQRFLMGLSDSQARIHIELTKDPRTIEEAVHEVITYIDTTQESPENYNNRSNRRSVRQVKKNEGKGRQNWNARKPQPQANNKIDNSHKSNGASSGSISKDDLKKAFDQMYKEQQKLDNRGTSFESEKQTYSRNQNLANAKNTFLCYYCGQPGHYARNCYSNPNRQTDGRYDRNQITSGSQPKQWTGQKQNFNNQMGGTEFRQGQDNGAVSEPLN